MKNQILPSMLGNFWMLRLGMLIIIAPLLGFLLPWLDASSVSLSSTSQKDVLSSLSRWSRSEDKVSSVPSCRYFS